LRKDKYRALESQDVESSDWQKLAPAAPYFYFVPQNEDLLSEYQEGWKFLP